MVQHLRRNDADSSNGVDLGDPEVSLELVGQEIVPQVASPGEFLSTAGAINQSPPTRSDLVLVAAQGSLMRPMASDAARNQGNGMQGQMVTTTSVLNMQIATPESVQSAPTGQPVTFGPPAHPLALQDAENVMPNGPQGENLLPLFDDQQLRRFAEIYQQAPTVYPPADYVRRPIFLEQDGREVEARRGVGEMS